MSITKHEGWLKDYKDGFIRSILPQEASEVLLATIGQQKREKYVEGDTLIIDVYYDDMKVLRSDLKSLSNLNAMMSDNGLHCVVSIAR